MYTILINDNNTLTQTVKERIMHRSSNVNTFRFLVNPTWTDRGVVTDMRNYDCIMEYRTPISNRYTPMVLTPSEELYKEKLEYLVPIDTRFTSEIGELEIKFIFTWLEMDADGKFIEHSRKTDTVKIEILRTDQWSDYIADSNLDNIAQIMMQTQAQAEQIRMYNELIYATKADGIKYDPETNKLDLTANGAVIDSATLEECDLEDGIPVVDFNVVNPDDAGDELDNVVEF